MTGSLPRLPMMKIFLEVSGHRHASPMKLHLAESVLGGRNEIGIDCLNIQDGSDLAVVCVGLGRPNFGSRARCGQIPVLPA